MQTGSARGGICEAIPISRSGLAKQRGWRSRDGHGGGGGGSGSRGGARERGGEALAAGACAVGVADAVSAAVVDTAGVGVLSLGLMFTDWNDIDITLTICF